MFCAANDDPGEREAVRQERQSLAQDVEHWRRTYLEVLSEHRGGQTQRARDRLQELLDSDLFNLPAQEAWDGDMLQTAVLRTAVLVHETLGEQDAARQLCLEAIEGNERRAWFWHRLGCLLGQTNRMAAKVALSEACRLDADNLVYSRDLDLFSRTVPAIAGEPETGVPDIVIAYAHVLGRTAR
jgi:hypothetical protein